MGAFVAGLMISEVEYDQTPNLCGAVARYLCHPVFAAIGMLIDPVFLWNRLILGLVALVLVGKFLIVTPLVKAFHYP